MDKTRRRLMAFSLFILGFAAYTLVSLGLELFLGSGFDNLTVPEGAPANIIDITKTFIIVVTLLLVLPQIYVGIKGVRVARNPDSSGGHIFWAVVLFIFALVSIVSAFINLVSNGGAGDGFSMMIDGAIEAIFYLEFIIYARRVKNEY